MSNKVWGVEIWHGTTAVYCDKFDTLEAAEEYVQWCKKNARDGWYRKVWEPVEFESETQFRVWVEDTEGMK